MHTVSYITTTDEMSLTLHSIAAINRYVKTLS